MQIYVAQILQAEKLYELKQKAPDYSIFIVQQMEPAWLWTRNVFLFTEEQECSTT